MRRRGTGQVGDGDGTEARGGKARRRKLGASSGQHTWPFALWPSAGTESQESQFLPRQARTTDSFRREMARASQSPRRCRNFWCAPRGGGFPTSLRLFSLLFLSLPLLPPSLPPRGGTSLCDPICIIPPPLAHLDLFDDDDDDRRQQHVSSLVSAACGEDSDSATVHLLRLDRDRDEPPPPAGEERRVGTGGERGTTAVGATRWSIYYFLSPPLLLPFGSSPHRHPPPTRLRNERLARGSHRRLPIRPDSSHPDQPPPSEPSSRPTTPLLFFFSSLPPALLRALLSDRLLSYLSLLVSSSLPRGGRNAQKQRITK